MSLQVPTLAPDYDRERSEQQRHQTAASDNDVLILQVRAFLEASEDVDIDVETVEDLVQSLPADFETELDPVGEYESANEDENDDHSPNEGAHGDSHHATEGADPGLFATEEEDEPTWTAHEVTQMMHHLKERGMASWINEYVLKQNLPIPKLLHAFGISLCKPLQSKKPTTLLYFLKVALSRELRIRDKLTQYNTISDAVKLISSSRRILILTGAGISVSCGIPDFRSRDGLYASLKDRGQYDLEDPQQMFDINYFRENPADDSMKKKNDVLDMLSSFARQIYPSNFIPSPCHRFIKLIEDKNQLLRNYTQNIDTLETLAGVQHVLQCHGSFATASCLLCRRRVPGSEIEADIMNQKVALCTVCNPLATPKKKKKRSKKKAKGEWDSNDEDESDGPAYPPGIMKPDITFFGEKLTDEFDKSLEADRELVDLLLVIGTSLKVSPVAEILSHLPHSVPQILINKTPIRHINPDIVLLGNADDIVQYLCGSLCWELPIPPPAPALHDPTVPPSVDPRSALGPPQTQIPSSSSSSNSSSTVCAPPIRVGDSHVWLFEGAEGGRWLDELKKKMAVRTRSQTPSVTPPSLTPLVVDSDTRLPTPSPSRTPGTISTSTSAFAAPYLKRESDANRDKEERAAKKARP